VGRALQEEEREAGVALVPPGSLVVLFLDERLCPVAVPRVVTDELGVEEGPDPLDPVEVVVEVVTEDADAIGLVFYPPSPRAVTIEQAQAIVE